MIHVDESDPVGEIDLSFSSRDVTIKRGVDAKEIYELVTEIGRGKFGTVYRCQEKSTGLQLAAKFVPIPKRDDRRNVEREVEIMNSLQHPLIIQLYDALEYQKMMCVVLELIEGGELFDRVIDDDFVLTEKSCSVFIRQVCQAMEFIHRHNIIHLDLKPENILCITREGNRIKIIDFGLARKFDPDKKLQVLFGTPEFVAPEVVNFDQITYGTDMWSVGVISYVLLSGLSPFMGATDIETMANVTIGKYDFDDETFLSVSKEALDFIAKLLVKDTSNRMSAEQCLEHSWLKRPSKPQVAIKPIVVPPARYKSPPPLQAIKIIQVVDPDNDDNNNNNNNGGGIGVNFGGDSELVMVNGNLNTKNNGKIGIDDELKTTKDNLKSFIERWEEHPNSPYVFDASSNKISPAGILLDVVDRPPTTSTSNLDTTNTNNSSSNNNRRNGSSGLSSRGCSPSPCESLASELPTTLSETTTASITVDEFDLPILLPKPNYTQFLTTAIAETKPSKILRQNSEFFQPKSSATYNESDNSQTREFKEYLQSFDRRHSDSNCILNNNSNCEKMDLAAEIQKLSERLMMLSSINTEINNNGLNDGNNNKTEEKLETDSMKTKKPAASVTTKSSKNEEELFAGNKKQMKELNKPQIKEKSESIKIKSKFNNSSDNLFITKVDTVPTSLSSNINLTSFKSANSSNQVNSSTTSHSISTQSITTTKNSSHTSSRTITTHYQKNGLSEKLKSLDEMPNLNGKISIFKNNVSPQQIKKSVAQKIEKKTTIESQGKKSSSPAITITTTTPTATTALDLLNNHGGSAPWPVTNRRTKFRLTQMSRDVPIGSPNTHQTVFLEEAVNTTKDCLLHLLDKYSETETRTAYSNKGRHQSVSMGFGLTDNLEYRSMNSLNFFFQRHATAGNTVKQMQAQLESKTKQ